MVANALEDTEPAACDGQALQLRPLGGSPMTAEGVVRNRAAIEAIVAQVTGRRLRIAVGESGTPAPGRGEGARGAVREASTGPSPSAPSGPGAPSAPPQRVTATGARAERVKALRQRDPTLDSAIDSLDLELLE